MRVGDPALAQKLSLPAPNILCETPDIETILITVLLSQYFLLNY